MEVAFAARIEAARIEAAAQAAHKLAAPSLASKAEICNSIQSEINKIRSMGDERAKAYIRESYTHNGHQALAVRMFKGQPV